MKDLTLADIPLWVTVSFGGYALGWLVDYSYWIATEGSEGGFYGIIAALFWPIHGAVVLWQWVLT